MNLKRFFLRSQETAQRMRRTAKQIIAAGGLGTVFGAVLEGKRAVLGGALVSIGMFIAAYANNTYNDLRPNRDPRTPTPPTDDPPVDEGEP